MFFVFLHDLKRITGFGNCIGLLEQCRRKWDLQSTDITRSFPRLGNSATGNIIRAYQRNRYFNDPLQDEIDIALKQIPALDMEKAPASMGLLTGYAGEGLYLWTDSN